MILLLLLFVPALYCGTFVSTSGLGYSPDGNLANYQDCTAVTGGADCARLVASFDTMTPNKNTKKRLNTQWSFTCSGHQQAAGSEDLSPLLTAFSVATSACVLDDGGVCETTVGTSATGTLSFPADFNSGDYSKLPPGCKFEVQCLVTYNPGDGDQTVELKKVFEMESYVVSDSEPFDEPGVDITPAQSFRMKYVELNELSLSNVLVDVSTADGAFTNPYASSVTSWVQVDPANGQDTGTTSTFFTGNLAGDGLTFALRADEDRAPGDRWVLKRNLNDGTDDYTDYLVLQWYEEVPTFNWVLKDTSTRPTKIEGPPTLSVAFDYTAAYTARGETIVYTFTCTDGAAGDCTGDLTDDAAGTCTFNAGKTPKSEETYTITGKACVNEAVSAAMLCSTTLTTEIVITTAADNVVGINADYSLDADGTLKPTTDKTKVSFSALEELPAASMDKSRRNTDTRPTYKWYLNDVEQPNTDPDNRGKYATFDTTTWGATTEVKVKVDDGTKDISASTTVDRPTALAYGVSVSNAGRVTYDEETDSAIRKYRYGINDKSGTRRSGGWATVLSPDGALWKNLNIYLSDPKYARTNDVFFPRDEALGIYAWAVGPDGTSSTGEFTENTREVDEPSISLTDAWNEGRKWAFLQKLYHDSYSVFCEKCTLVDALNTHAGDLFTGTQDREYLKAVINLMYRTLKNSDDLTNGRRNLPDDKPNCDKSTPGDPAEEGTFTDKAETTIGAAADALSTLLDDYAKNFPDEEVIVAEMLDLLTQYPDTTCSAADCFKDLLLKSLLRRPPSTDAVAYGTNSNAKSVLAAANTDGTTCYDKKCFRVKDQTYGPDDVAVFDWTNAYIAGSDRQRRGGTKDTADGNELVVTLNVYDPTKKTLDKVSVTYDKKADEARIDEYVCILDSAVDDGAYCTLTSDATTVTCDCEKTEGIGEVGVRHVGFPNFNTLTTGEIAGVVVGSVAGVAVFGVVVGLIILAILAATGVICRKAAAGAAAPATPVELEPTPEVQKKHEEKESSSSSSSDD